MKRSEVNRLVDDAARAFRAAGWALPPAPRWDVCEFGLVLVNLAEEPEYCEKLMYARRGMATPAHAHRRKKEDIVCRRGTLEITVWAGPPGSAEATREVEAKLDGAPARLPSGEPLVLEAGRRITLAPGVYHAFVPLSAECVLGEISTANDDANDNVFADPAVRRFAEIEEDEPARARLVGERPVRSEPNALT